MVRRTANRSQVLLLALFMLSFVAPGVAAQAGENHCIGGLLDVQLVIDVSGSMSGAKLTNAKQGARELVQGLNSQDQSGLVSFASTASHLKHLDFDHSRTLYYIDRLSAGGSTAMGDGVYVGTNEIRDHGRPQVRRIMIVLTDGYTNTGRAPLPEADRAKAMGIELFTVGIGDGVNEALLVAMASDADHYYHPLDPEQLLEDLRDIARRITPGFGHGFVLKAESNNGAEFFKVHEQWPSSAAGRRTNGSVIVHESDAVNETIVPLQPPVRFEIKGPFSQSESTGWQGGNSARSMVAIAEVSIRTDLVEIVRIIGVEVESYSTAFYDAEKGTTTTRAWAYSRAAGISLLGGPTMAPPAPGETAEIPGGWGAVSVGEPQVYEDDLKASSEISALQVELALPGTGSTFVAVVGFAEAAASCGEPVQEPTEKDGTLVTVTDPVTGEEHQVPYPFADALPAGLPSEVPAVPEPPLPESAPPTMFLVGEGFEAGDGGFSTSGLWERGTPTAGPSLGAGNGANVWGTDLDGNYGNNVCRWLVGPEFDMTGVPAGLDPVLRFSHWYQTESYYDGGIVQASKDGGPWTTLTPIGGYDRSVGSSARSCFGGWSTAYSGTGSGTPTDWKSAVFDISGLSGSEVRFRWLFASDGSVTRPGWYIDNVVVDFGSVGGAPPGGPGGPPPVTQPGSPLYQPLPGDHFGGGGLPVSRDRYTDGSGPYQYTSDCIRVSSPTSARVCLAMIYYYGDRVLYVQVTAQGQSAWAILYAYDDRDPCLNVSAGGLSGCVEEMGPIDVDDLVNWPALPWSAIP